jgi:mitochondrial cardiolipin hydrolase
MGKTTRRTLLAGILLASGCAGKTVATVSGSAVSVASPSPNETCFSPEEPCGEKVAKFVEGAAVSVDVAAFDINLDSVVAALIRASNRLTVRIVVDSRQARGPHSMVLFLLENGVNVRFGRQRRLMHNKFMIVDRQALQTGSFNYTKGAASFNQENQLYTSAPETVRKYQARFEQIWSSSRPATNKAISRK